MFVRGAAIELVGARVSCNRWVFSTVFARFLITVVMVGVGSVAQFTQSVLPRGIVVFGLHFADRLIRTRSAWICRHV